MSTYRTVWLTGAACLAFAAVAWAQRGPKPPTEPFEAEGTIEALAPGQLQINTNSNQKWLIALQQQTKVEVSGTATPEFLRPGLFVQFRAEFDKQYVAKDKVKELSVIMPTRDKPPGMWTEQAAGAEGERFGAGVEPGPKKPGKPGPAATYTAYSVTARITAARGERLTLSTGDANLSIEVSDTAKIEVKLPDLSLARQGDAIKVKGQMLPGRPGLGEATDVKVTAAQPFGGAAPAKTKPGKQPPKREPRSAKAT